MRKDQLHNIPNLRQERSMLRNNMTPAEEELWRLLGKHRLGDCKFRRQHSIGSYIVDFYCAQVEVDGSAHDTVEAMANDQVRDEAYNTLNTKLSASKTAKYSSTRNRCY